MLDIRKTIGNVIKNNRKRLKLTQAELATKVGVEPKYISRIETGVSYPSLSVIERIFNVLEIEMKDMLVEKETVDSDFIISVINSNLKQINPKYLKHINYIIETLLKE